MDLSNTLFHGFCFWFMNFDPRDKSPVSIDCRKCQTNRSSFHLYMWKSLILWQLCLLRISCHRAGVSQCHHSRKPTHPTDKITPCYGIKWHTNAQLGVCSVCWLVLFNEETWCLSYVRTFCKGNKCINAFARSRWGPAVCGFCLWLQNAWQDNGMSFCQFFSWLGTVCLLIVFLLEFIILSFQW